MKKKKNRWHTVLNRSFRFLLYFSFTKIFTVRWIKGVNRCWNFCRNKMCSGWCKVMNSISMVTMWFSPQENWNHIWMHRGTIAANVAMHTYKMHLLYSHCHHHHHQYNRNNRIGQPLPVLRINRKINVPARKSPTARKNGN